MSSTVAALFVHKGGVYYGLEGVDPWDEERDARLYPGPWPVVAHPPCARWSRLAGMCEAKYGLRRGEDGGCFASALASVRRWGGVLEHPADTRAWDAFDLPVPPSDGGWIRGIEGGWACCVEQGSYGHPAPKRTWLYAYGVPHLPSLRWGPSGATGTCVSSVPERRRKSGGRIPAIKNIETPAPFRDVLLEIARSVVTRSEAAAQAEAREAELWRKVSELGFICVHGRIVKNEGAECMICRYGEPEGCTDERCPCCRRMARGARGA